MAAYYFGSGQNHREHYEARSIEHAIKLFKVGELFPEDYVDDKYIRKNSKEYYIGDYDSALGRYLREFKKGAKIFIYDGENKKVGEVLLSECINVDFSEMLPSVPLLPAPEVITEEPENLPVVGSERELASYSTKIALREKHDEILRKKAELEAMVHELNKSLNALKKEVKQKLKIVYVLETFLGIREEVVQLREGKGSDDAEPLYLYQQQLYMDEEVGLWEEDGGLDFKNIDVFDEWIMKNFKRYLYKPKSVCIWRVRRNDKNYHDPWINMQWAIENEKCYFLIRDGDRLYRIWSDVSVEGRLFPTKNEYQSIVDEYKEWNDPKRAQEKIKDKHETYLFGLIALQGLIERTEVFGEDWTKKARGKISLMKPDSIDKSLLDFIRDSEPECWLTDGRPKWRDFLKKNRSKITQGTRVVLSVRPYHFSFTRNSKDRDNDLWRCSPFRPGFTPSMTEIYTIEDIVDESQYRHGMLKIYYGAGEEYWIGVEKSNRKRNVPFLLYRDEVLSIDDITLEECQHYETCRLDRGDYYEMLPVIHFTRIVLQKERALEAEFLKLLAGKLGWDEGQYPKIWDAIRWWKIKNKWRRAVTKDAPKALRMILKKLGDQHE